MIERGESRTKRFVDSCFNEIMGGPEKGRLSFMNNINYSLVLVRWHLGIFERLRVWLLVG